MWQRVTDSLHRRTGDAARHLGDFSKPVSITTINQRSRDAAARHAAPTLDVSGRMVYSRGSTKRTADSGRMIR